MKNNWIVKDKEVGIYKKFRSINKARLYYEELKGQGFKPKITKLITSEL